MRSYVFIDESGNLDFSKTGTKYYILTSITVCRPFDWNSTFATLKYDIAEKFDIQIERFHASEDKQKIRDSVFKVISVFKKNIIIDSIVIEKRKANPSIRDITKFYPMMMNYLLSFVNRKLPESNYLQVIADKFDYRKKQKVIEKVCNSQLTKMNRKYKLTYMDSKSNYELQIVDYCCWAIYRKWQNEDTRSYNIIQSSIRSEFDIFRWGNNFFY